MTHVLQHGHTSQPSCHQVLRHVSPVYAGHAHSKRHGGLGHWCMCRFPPKTKQITWRVHSHVCSDSPFGFGCLFSEVLENKFFLAQNLRALFYRKRASFLFAYSIPLSFPYTASSGHVLLVMHRFWAFSLPFILSHRQWGTESTAELIGGNGQENVVGKVCANIAKYYSSINFTNTPRLLENHCWHPSLKHLNGF